MHHTGFDSLKAAYVDGQKSIIREITKIIEGYYDR